MSAPEKHTDGKYSHSSRGVASPYSAVGQKRKGLAMEHHLVADGENRLSGTRAKSLILYSRTGIFKGDYMMFSRTGYCVRISHPKLLK